LAGSRAEDSIDYDDLLRRLTAQAFKLFAIFGMAGAACVLSGTGMSPEDLASQTLLKFLTGDGINYHSSKGPLFPFLALVMERDLMDMAKRHAHSHTEVLDPASDGGEKNGERKKKTLMDFPARGKTAEAIVSEREFREGILELVQDDPNLQDVIVAVVDLDLQKREEIADALGVTADEVTNRKKVLQRRLAKSLGVERQG
jgi:DNA-directed RNA polymerase specialized sigma24 family protein